MDNAKLIFFTINLGMSRSSPIRVLSRASPERGHTARPPPSNVTCTILLGFNSLCVYKRSVSDPFERPPNVYYCFGRISGENLGHRRRRTAENGDRDPHGDRTRHQRQRSETPPRLPSGLARARSREKSRRSAGHGRRRPVQEQRSAVHV